MKNSTKTILLVLIATLFCSPLSAFACESCQKSFEDQIRSGISSSAHATELLRLIETAEKNALLQNIPDENPAATLLRTATDATSAALNGENPLNRDLIKRRDAHPHSRSGNNEELPSTSYVPPGTKPDKKVTITMMEGETSIGNGVIYKGFMIDGKIPGPTIIVDEGDVIEFTVVNKGNVPHGVSIHAAYTQTSKHLGKIAAGETKSMLFRASYPGVYMYHCAPGGHAIPMHVLLGQYGMMVVRPKEQYRMEKILNKKPDVEVFLLQHELYANGRDAIKGNALYTLFNGKLFRHVEEPVVANPGDFIRINFLNVGPNLISTFHLVGIIWDFAYWQGLPNEENTFVGGQTVLAGPSDSWVVDFRAPEDEGAYLMLTHAVGSATRGGIGILNVTKDGKRTPKILADGPEFNEKTLAELKEKAVRIVSPTEPSPEEIRNPWRLPYGETRANVQIIGNSYYPKVIEVPVGTTVEWTNEEVFTYFDGEFSGIHNVVAFQGPETFASPMLGHAEKFEHTFTKAGEYNYLCTPHPYMRGIVRVVEK